MKEARINVSRNQRKDNIQAVLVLLAKGKPSETEMLARFRRSVSQWLANTQRGKLAWEDSVHDFNYGDFVSWNVQNDPDFLEFLEANGIYCAKVTQETPLDLGETYDSLFRPEGI